MHVRGAHLIFALFRIYAGIFWLAHGIPKFTNPSMFMPPNGFMQLLVARATQQGTTGWYHDFLVSVVTPNMNLFAQLDRLGEVLVGCSLLFGLLTKVGGLGGAFLAFNYLMAKGGFSSLESLGTLDTVAIVLSLMNVVLPTGRALGVDALFVRRRVVREPTVTPEFVDEPPPTVTT